MSSQTAAPLKSDLENLDIPGRLSRDHAEEFVHKHSLESLFSAIQSGEVEPGLLARVLEKVLDSGVRVQEMPRYALLALHSADPSLRRLAAKQVGVGIQMEVAASGTSGSAAATAGELLSVLADPDTGVAFAARQSLQNLATTRPGLEVVLGEGAGGPQLRQLATSTDPTIRMRATSLVAGLAATSPEAAAEVRSRGLLEPLAEEVGRSEDPLGCAAALELVTQLAHCSGPAASSLLGEKVLPNLKKLVAQEDAFLKGLAIQALGALVAAAAAVGITGEADSSPLGAYVMGLLEGILHPDTEAQEDTVNAALASVGQTATTRNGRELLATTPLLVSVADRALSPTGARSSQIPAMHALAGLLGASGPEEDWSTANSVLRPILEARLQDAVFDAVGGRSLAATLLQRLQQPFEELHFATYRVLEALAMHIWGAREICSEQQLLARLCDSRSEVGPQGRHHRITCLQKLRATVKQQSLAKPDDFLASAAAILDQACKEESYPAPKDLPPQVATMQL